MHLLHRQAAAPPSPPSPPSSEANSWAEVSFTELEEGQDSSGNESLVVIRPSETSPSRRRADEPGWRSAKEAPKKPQDQQHKKTASASSSMGASASSSSLRKKPLLGSLSTRIFQSEANAAVRILQAWWRTRGVPAVHLPDADEATEDEVMSEVLDEAEDTEDEVPSMPRCALSRTELWDQSVSSLDSLLAGCEETSETSETSDEENEEPEAEAQTSHIAPGAEAQKETRASQEQFKKCRKQQFQKTRGAANSAGAPAASKSRHAVTQQLNISKKSRWSWSASWAFPRLLGAALPLMLLLWTWLFGILPTAPERSSGIPELSSSVPQQLQENGSLLQPDFAPFASSSVPQAASRAGPKPAELPLVKPMPIPGTGSSEGVGGWWAVAAPSARPRPVPLSSSEGVADYVSAVALEALEAARRDVDMARRTAAAALREAKAAQRSWMVEDRARRAAELDASEARQQLAALLRALEANRSRNGEAAANDRREGSEDPPAAATDMASLALTLCQTFGFGSAGTSWFWAPEPVPQPAVSVSNYPFALAEFEEAELTQEQAGSPDCNSTDSNDVHEDLQLESTDDGTQFFDALFEERAAAGSDLEVEEQAAVEQPEEPPAQRAGGKKAAVAESSHFASHLILWPGMDSWRLLASAEAEEPTKEAERQEQDLQPAVREKQETVDKLVAPSTTQAVWSMRKLPAMLPPPPSRAKNSQVPQSRPKSSTAPPAVAGVRAAWHQHWQTYWNRSPPASPSRGRNERAQTLALALEEQKQAMFAEIARHREQLVMKEHLVQLQLESLGQIRKDGLPSGKPKEAPKYKPEKEHWTSWTQERNQWKQERHREEDQRQTRHYWQTQEQRVKEDKNQEQAQAFGLYDFKFTSKAWVTKAAETVSRRAERWVSDAKQRAESWAAEAGSRAARKAEHARQRAEEAQRRAVQKVQLAQDKAMHHLEKARRKAERLAEQARLKATYHLEEARKTAERKANKAQKYAAKKTREAATQAREAASKLFGVQWDF